jgi:uncharacterized SAM-binding protein YcdF (DUF218 family)
MSTNGSIDAVIVLGAPPLGPGVPGPAIERRLDHAIAVFRARGAGHLVPSGGAVGAPPAEAEIMRTLALAKGVADGRIIVEDRARNTFENALYTGLIMRRRGWRRVVVVTDAFHMPRALYVYRRLGLKVSGDPVRIRQPGSLSTRLRLYAREALAFARCAWLFRIGRHKPFVAAVWGE